MTDKKTLGADVLAAEQSNATALRAIYQDTLDKLVALQGQPSLPPPLSTPTSRAIAQGVATMTVKLQDIDLVDREVGLVEMTPGFPLVPLLDPDA